MSKIFIFYHEPHELVPSVRTRTKIKCLLLAVVVLIVIGCVKGESFPSVSAVSGAWLDIKTELISLIDNTANDARIEKLEKEIADFRIVLIGF